MSGRIPACPRGIAPAQLSLYRDGDLPEHERRDLDAHIPTCAACSVAQADFAAVGRLLRAQRVDGPDGRLWRAVRDGMEQVRPLPRRRVSVGRVAGAMSAVAAAAVVVVGFARLLALAPGATTVHPTATATFRASPTSTAKATPAPTATPLPQLDALIGMPLAWRHTALPAGYGLLFHSSDVAVAPSDGATAYACAVPGGVPDGGAARVIVTHDAGATWSQTAAFDNTWGGCGAARVDALAPTRAIVSADLGPSSPYVQTTDGGATWAARAAPGGLVSVYTMATLGTSTYTMGSTGGQAAVLIAQEGATGAARTLAARMPNGEYPGYFWLNPARPDAILLRTFSAFYATTDGGDHWTAVAGVENAVAEAARATTSGAGWTICDVALRNDGLQQAMVCTDDLGVTWRQLPAMHASGTPSPVSYSGFGSDGSLIAVAPGTTGQHIYRLPPGAPRWTDLGPLPPGAAGVTLYPDPHGGSIGILWAFPSESDGAGTSGPPDSIYSVALEG